MSQRVYLSLGSNVGNREDNLRAAIQALRPYCEDTEISSLYETDPVGVVDQQPFLNVAVTARTSLGPEELLGVLKHIEHAVGRRPTFRWGPRSIDIDIVLFDDLSLRTDSLVIPHPEMARRAFVLVPLAEIAPQVVHPDLGLTVAELRDRVGGSDTVRRVRSTL